MLAQAINKTSPTAAMSARKGCENCTRSRDNPLAAGVNLMKAC